MAKILVASQYYPPEPGATSNRLGGFVTGLAERGHEVTVVCEQPNHPAGRFQPGYGEQALVVEKDGDVEIQRVWVRTAEMKTVSVRLAFYATYAAGAGAVAARMTRPDVAFASSPPLPGVLAVARVMRSRRVPFIVDVRDIWPAVAEALGELTDPRVVRAFERAERWLYRVAHGVTATTKPFCRHIDRVAGEHVSVHMPNGALDDYLELDEPPPAEGPFTIGYAGNLGIAQGLRIVLDAAEELRDEDVRFLLLGDGPLSQDLRHEAAARGLANVEFRSGVPALEAGRVMQGCHALLVPLGAQPLLADFIPSKLYDAMALGRPAIVAARGEAPKVVEKHRAGCVVPPEDGPALAAVARELADDRAGARRMGEVGRAAAPDLTRSRQVDLLEDILLAAAGLA